MNNELLAIKIGDKLTVKDDPALRFAGRTGTVFALRLDNIGALLTFPDEGIRATAAPENDICAYLWSEIQ